MILCCSEAEAGAALAEVQAGTTAAGLRLHPTKTRIVNAHHEGLDFLGYHFAEGTRWPRAKSLKKFKDTIRDKTRRTQGQSLSAIIDEVNRTVRGWLEYDQHSRRFTFDLLDSWVRMRLRSILRRRQGRRGRGRGAGPSALAEGLLCQAWVVLSGRCPCCGLSILVEVKPPTGEPDAGEPPVRFGGRGERDHSVLPTPIFIVPVQGTRNLVHAGSTHGSEIAC